ncbi:MAG: mechanosensitive ion channel family protein [Trueperaceae bacterium]|nr:mechanosensitive ion channel family protein [Trueperaceae bacterium]
MTDDPGLETFAFLAALGNPDLWWSVARAAIYLIAGAILARAVRFAVNRSLTTLETGQRVLLARIASYTVLTLFAISAMRQFGFDFTVLLGAAGIVTVAVGFASQTSASNLISGLFLILERAVQPGDVVTVGGRTGEVISVDLLSTKLRTFDNLLVRIPNETMVKSEIVSLNRFPIRRVDLRIGVAYDSDLGLVQKTLFDVAHRNPLCLDEPAPLLIADGFGASSIDYLFAVWAASEHWLTLRNTITREVKEAFDAAGIEIPFPQRTLQPGSTPLAVHLVAAPPTRDASAPGDVAEPS